MDTTNNKKYVYDIKFEVVLNEVKGTIPGKASLTKSLTTLQHARRKTEKIDFFDTNGIQISPTLQGIEQDEIEGRFSMEIGGFDENTLFFACKIQTTIPFSILKSRTIDEFKKHGIYFKIHRGGFKYGVNWSPIGFFLKQHPGYVDNIILRDDLMAKITKSWNNDNEFFDDEQKEKIIRIIEPDSNQESFDPMTIPFEIIQASIYAKNDTNEQIRANAVVLTIPFQFFKVGIAIMDYLVIATEIITNYIPLGYKKEEPEKYFNLVEDHIQWMESCRNITITNVPSYNHYVNVTNHMGASLESILKNVKEIDNMCYIRNRNQVNILVPEQKQGYATNIIKDLLTSAAFPFKPQLAKKFNPTGSLGSSKSGTSKYSAVLAKYQKEQKSPNASVASSNGGVSRLTGQTGKSWGTSRKIPKEIDFTDSTEFPPIATDNAKPHETQTQNTSHQQQDSSITDTTAIIQQAIESALKKAYEVHKQEIVELQEKYQQQIKELQRQTTSTSLEHKFDEKFDKLMDMMTTMTSNITRESPIRKKGKQSSDDNVTPPRGMNQDHEEKNMHTEDTEMFTENSDEGSFIGPQFTANSPTRKPNIHDTTATVLESRYDKQNENDDDEKKWINPYADKERRQQQRNDKKTTEPKPLYQQKIEDSIKHVHHNSPTRNHRNSPDRPGRGSPNRNNRYTAPRPIQAEKNQGTNVVLSSLSSSRRDTVSRERES